jgi:GTP-binding protein Era
VVINKKDTLKKDADLDEQTAKLKEIGVFDKVVATSAKDNDGVDELLAVIDSYAMEGPHYFEEDAITNMPEKVIVSEIVREKLLLNLFEEIPHGTNVEVEKFKERKGKNMVDISVVIYCERKSHKGMIIGKQGTMLKKISSQARMDIEQFLGTHVRLTLFVRVEEDWRDIDSRISQYGYGHVDE